MLGTFVVDAKSTFTAALLMSSAPKLKFNSTEQDTTKDGRLKWSLEVAVTFAAEPRVKPPSEVVTVTIVSGSDPAAAVPPGSPIEFSDFKVGWTTAEKTETGGIRGGRPFFQASGIRAVRQSVAAGKPE